MPYETRWVPAPSDLSLPVLTEPPEGATDWPSLGGPKEVRLGHRHFYHCRDCGGWIEGHPNEYRVDTLAPLSGRRGTEYFCLRFGQEIGFSGLMS